MRIGILTSGGDVPGLNACIKSIVYASEKNGWDVLGIKRGWRGLLDYNLNDENDNNELFFPLKSRKMHGVENTGGTILHTTRFNPVEMDEGFLPHFLKGKVPASPFKAGAFDCTDHILKVLDRMEIDVLIPIGGDGSLR
ncbi:MAG: phosphofructokinase, partial [Kordiimonadaceae bacterium]|nr:phosphofructokinase [Kordiimonadaceae bacterium]